MARMEDMATIDLALSNSLPTSSPDDSQQNTTLIDPPSFTPDQKRAADSARQDQKRAADSARADQKQNYDLSRQSALDQEQRLKQQVAEEEKQQSALLQSARSTANAASGILRSTGGRIAQIPTPGSLVLPILVLLIFFVMLLPVNGHTRLVWLWMVLSNNASVNNPNGGASSGNPSAPGETTGPVSTVTGQASQSTPFTFTFPMLTTAPHVEEPV